MGPDRTRQFLSVNATRVPAGERVLGVIVGEPEGGTLRRGLVEAGSAVPVPEYEMRERARAAERRKQQAGDAASWPVAPMFWLVLTDRHLHVFEASLTSDEAGAGPTSYAREKIAGIDYRRRPLTSKLTVRFRDGSSVALDVGWQKMRPFLQGLAGGPGNRRS